MLFPPQNPAPPKLTVQPLRSNHVADKCHITGTTRLKWDGVDPEVLQHVKDGLEPEMLNPALPILIEREAQVLVVGEGKVINSLISHIPSLSTHSQPKTSLYLYPCMRNYLGFPLEVKGQDIFTTPCLTLPH